MMRVAVVTGASRGIGLAIAEALAGEGCHLVLCARGQGGLNRVAARLKRGGTSVVTFPADLTESDAARRLTAHAVRHFGQIDVWVNNVGGLLHARPFAKLTAADWQKTLALNLLSAVHSCRAVIPVMQRQKAGHIIQIASTAGIDVVTKYPDYAVAKAGLIALSQALSVELAPERIAVNTVCPGSVWTSSWDTEAKRLAGDGDPDEMARRIRAAVSSQIPWGRMGEPHEVARLVAFLASPQTAWMTGAVIRLDGGGQTQRT
jgi:3-oxoacyl-[acyl-carrier protein] reductase